jgi:hypothetical protein
VKNHSVKKKGKKLLLLLLSNLTAALLEGNLLAVLRRA